jgi:hypothetical protein
MKYRKKPVVIDAVQWSGSHSSLTEISTLGGVMEHPNGLDLTIDTLEGTMTANLDDWIIKGIKGELYPCKPDIFEATYEKVEEPPPKGAV